MMPAAGARAVSARGTIQRKPVKAKQEDGSEKWYDDTDLSKTLYDTETECRLKLIEWKPGMKEQAENPKEIDLKELEREWELAQKERERVEQQKRADQLKQTADDVWKFAERIKHGRAGDYKTHLTKICDKSVEAVKDLKLDGKWFDGAMKEVESSLSNILLNAPFQVGKDTVYSQQLENRLKEYAITSQLKVRIEKVVKLATTLKQYNTAQLKKAEQTITDCNKEIASIIKPQPGPSGYILVTKAFVNSNGGVTGEIAKKGIKEVGSYLKQVENHWRTGLASKDRSDHYHLDGGSNTLMWVANMKKILGVLGCHLDTKNQRHVLEANKMKERAKEQFYNMAIVKGGLFEVV